MHPTIWYIVFICHHDEVCEYYIAVCMLVGIVVCVDTVVISGDDVCCSVVFGTLLGVCVYCYYLSSVVISVRVPERGVCVHISSKD